IITVKVPPSTIITIVAPASAFEIPSSISVGAVVPLPVKISIISGSVIGHFASLIISSGFNTHLRSIALL
ncbi:MAG: hypothetical protein Q4P05_08740, partial [Actinomycetaceae bacterium]|nr:hypothetical protein [Actinomycetaceae bacterium]